MSILDFLAKMANKTHYDPEVNRLLDAQSDEVKNAFLANDSDLVKKQFTTIKNCSEQSVVIL